MALVTTILERFQPGGGHPGFQVDDLIASLIDNPELKAFYFAVRSNDAKVAE